MTNEEAYEILENSECFGAVELYKKDEIEAFHAALEALKVKPCKDTISREHLLSEIDELMKSPWFNNGKDFYDGTMRHYGYVERKEAVEVVRDLCVKTEPSATPKPTECEDSVSRKAVMQALTELGYGDEENGADVEYMSALCDVTEKVKALPSVIQKQKLCKDCKFFEYDSVANVNGIPLIVAHEICNKWGDGCKTKEDGYCFLFESKEGESDET